MGYSYNLEEKMANFIQKKRKVLRNYNRYEIILRKC